MSGVLLLVCKVLGHRILVEERRSHFFIYLVYHARFCVCCCSPLPNELTHDRVTCHSGFERQNSCWLSSCGLINLCICGLDSTLEINASKIL